MRSTAWLLTGSITVTVARYASDLVAPIAHAAATLILPKLSLALQLCELGLLREDLIPSLLHFGAALQQPISIMRGDRNEKYAACNIRGIGYQDGKLSREGNAIVGMRDAAS